MCDIHHTIAAMNMSHMTNMEVELDFLSHMTNMSHMTHMEVELDL